MGCLGPNAYIWDASDQMQVSHMQGNSCAISNQGLQYILFNGAGMCDLQSKQQQVVEDFGILKAALTKSMCNLMSNKKDTKGSDKKNRSQNNLMTQPCNYTVLETILPGSLSTTSSDDVVIIENSSYGFPCDCSHYNMSGPNLVCDPCSGKLDHY